ncbi:MULTISPECIES: DNA mismatch repair protein MutS [Metabacillus]|jgi:DNA mismatch repair protein MutS|uniref:DNA mismatch repair protein MutS n=1 Tax=Metabacillus rhizolycopersici TaxID=2875709 RepID=A0ABS7UQT6_9BACI|nr:MULTISPECIES: DNA mismatch repair protein MutS [Metabacillus]MBZ5750521.1 DNA mismatch repair protein MutS [Metabacillus rhizolycopersici]MCM3653995.1 DNA mismatch repair protein MutS [Metabacillus litoralis]
MATYTPMIQQYLKIKADYQDAFLFFRLGDFYEMFFQDAINASQELEITLTSRDGGGDEKIPMCGVPYHAAPNYIEQLILKGFKVAICEQTEDPKQAKGVVRREVVQLITPGTVMDGKGIHDKENNYIASITAFDSQFGLALSDLTTGENLVAICSSFDEILNEIYSVGAKEVVISSNFPDEWKKQLIDRCQATLSYESETTISSDFVEIIEELHDERFTCTFGRLLTYLQRTQKRSLEHLQQVNVYYLHDSMKIDLHSKRNLELTETIRSKGKKGSLLWLLDETKTAMGGRLLKQWVDKPLVNRAKIEARLTMVETLISNYFEREDLRALLKEVYDLERLAGRVAFGNVNARDLLQLNKSLQQVPAIEELCQSLKNEVFLSEPLDACEDLSKLLEDAIVENPPLSVKEGNIIRDGYHAQLDQYRDASRNGKTWIAQLEQQERQKTGIKSLKIGYNRVFGYYIEVTRANLHLLQEGMYERKQTLTNAERFITPELKEKETLILEAEEKIVELEYQLFVDLREQVKQYIPRLQLLAKRISELDVLQCFATVSENRHYSKPQFSQTGELFMKDGRHPVVEKVMDSQEYVPNDCFFNDQRQMLLITGPNMSGKSTYMRQVALTAILAQIGCYVPASEAVLPIFDQIFTRIGAADDLISGQSTFMVEMLEAKNAIAHATSQSLILFDEIGRGTSTYDGMALAQAIIEHIHEHIGAKTLFSTHYHELTILEEQLSSLKNIHVKAIEENGKVVFLHKIEEGAADKSYGIHVAELADLPKSLITRAKEILIELEADKTVTKPMTKETVVKEEVYTDAQLSLFSEEKKIPKKAPSLQKKEQAVIDLLKSMNLLEMTPLDAMNELYQLQKKVK